MFFINRGSQIMSLVNAVPWHVLITRGVIQFTDLPEPAQAKLLERRETRASLNNRLQLLPMDSDNDLV